MAWLNGIIPNADTLRNYERIYRGQLNSEPADMDSRVDLAWCLFMLALYHAGIESSEECKSPIAEPLEKKCGISRAAESSALLWDCLRQTIIVSHLSKETDNR